MVGRIPDLITTYMSIGYYRCGPHKRMICPVRAELKVLVGLGS